MRLLGAVQLFEPLRRDGPRRACPGGARDFALWRAPALGQPPTGLVPVEAVIIHYACRSTRALPEWKSSLHRDEPGGGGADGFGCLIVQSHRSTGMNPVEGGLPMRSNSSIADRLGLAFRRDSA